MLDREMSRPLHAFSFKEGPRPPLGFAKGGPKIFKGGPKKIFFADRSGTWPQPGF